MWPGDDPNLLFPDTVYNFAGYKNHWWNLMNKDGHNETHYTKIKFGPTWINQRNQKPPWLDSWWFDYGLSAYSMDPYYFESYWQSKCEDCLERIGECFHTPCQTVRDIGQFEYRLINFVLRSQ